jgi:hypothetical protein
LGAVADDGGEDCAVMKRFLVFSGSLNSYVAIGGSSDVKQETDSLAEADQWIGEATEARRIEWAEVLDRVEGVWFEWDQSIDHGDGGLVRAPTVRYDGTDGGTP